MVHISDVQSPIFCLFNNAIFTMIVWEKVVHFLFWCEPQIVTFWIYTFSWTTFFLLQEINVVHISDVARPIFCLSTDTAFIKNTQTESGSIFCLMWTTYCRDFEEDFQLIFMNHIRLLIRNQCGSHIIHGIPNPLFKHAHSNLQCGAIISQYLNTGVAR